MKGAAVSEGVMPGERVTEDRVDGSVLNAATEDRVPFSRRSGVDIPSGPASSPAMESDSTGLLSVADVRHATGITRKALRLYEIRGLVHPVERTQAGYRLYDNEALRRIRLVGLAKALGLTLAEAAELIDMAEGCCALANADIEVWVRRKIENVELLIQQLVCRHDELRRVLATLVGPEALTTTAQ